VYILNTVFVSKIIATDNMQGSQIINMEVLKNSIGSPKDEKLVNKNSAIIASFFDVYFKKGYEIVSTSGQFDATTYILRKR
jgi:hypothetical protein